MRLLNNKLLAFLLLAIFFKCLLWTALVPMWQAPDEQAHFVQLQDIAETGGVRSDKNLSAEIANSEKLLGTFRDQLGNNSYTYHPQFNIPYTKIQIGEYEPILNKPNYAARKIMVGQEAALYPPFYYYLSLPPYQLLYSHGIIDRLFASRFISILLNILLVIVAFQVGKEIWGNEIFALAIAVMVGFQPMVSFVAAGFHPDNLLNLLTSMLIIVVLLTWKNGIKLKYLLYLVALSLLASLTKQFVVFLVPSVAALVVFKLFKKRPFGIFFAVVILISPIISFLIQLPISYIPRVTTESPLYSLTFWQYLKFRLPKIAFEMWPWFWGVFKWLGVALPSTVMKIVTRIAALSILGILIKIILTLKSKKYDFEFQTLLFFLLTTISYTFYLIFWDWRLMQAIGFSQGLQGRYLFPIIVPIMGIILIGLKSLIPKALQRYLPTFLIVISLSMILLNSIELWTLARSYYSLTSITEFVIQASQYKPVIFKGQGLILILIFYGISLIAYFYSLAKIKDNNGK